MVFRSSDFKYHLAVYQRSTRFR